MTKINLKINKYDKKIQAINGQNHVMINTCKSHDNEHKTMKICK